MVYIAKEMERAKIDIPLLIGGATTSRVHTAVKIDEHYNYGKTVHVLDASRSVTVVESLLGNKKEHFVSELNKEYKKLRENHAKHVRSKALLGISRARENKLKLIFDSNTVFEPKKPGVHTLHNIPLHELLPYIDWTPFFQTWELHGRYPKILSDKIVGIEAKSLFNDAQIMLETIISESWLHPKAVFGIFPANSVGDDIEIYSDQSRNNILHIQRTLRQQSKKAKGQANMALSDFIAPKQSGIIDYIGGFAVTSGIGIKKHIERFEKDHDDYNSIMLKALADRLAEALAEYLHEKVRKIYWGYSNDEKYSNEELIKEKYRGIRPAPGYPACPDHTEKIGLFKLLNVEEKSGIQLTENLAMTPASSVSGWYFAHPKAKYFGLGKVTKEQIQDLANRKKVNFSEIERWYSSVLI